MGIVRTNDVTAVELEATRRLADSLRSLMLATARSGAAADTLHCVADRVDELMEMLGPAMRPGAIRLALEDPIRARFDQTDLRTGSYTGFSVPLEVSFMRDGTSARAEFVADALLEGPPTAVHGGIVAWIFDVILGVLVQAQGEGAVTKSLSVSYVRPTPLGVPLVTEARLVKVEGRHTAVEATISASGKITARASGDFVVPQRMPGVAADDDVGERPRGRQL